MQNNINYQGIQDLVLMLGFLGTFVGYFFVFFTLTIIES